MTQSLLSNMRSSNPFMRISASVAIVTFLMLILMPTAMAAQTINNASTPQNTPAAAPNIEAELSETIQKIQKKMGKLQDKIAKKQDADLEKGDLKDLHKKVKELDKKVVKKFNKIEQHLKDKGLSNVIMQRHYDMVANYRSELVTMLQNLSEVELAKDNVELEKKVEKAKKHLDSKKHKRSHQPFDPNNLPFSVPDGKVRKPKRTKEEFNALLSDPKPIQVASTYLSAGMLSTSAIATSLLPQPEDLQPTEDVQITDEIKALALQLEHNPVKIYNWVHNNIEFIPTYGSIQGSQMTLETKKGNAFDTSSLLISLLRASGIPARYAMGTVRIPIEKVMNWVGGVTVPEAALQVLGKGGVPSAANVEGGKIVSVEMEHIWVDAWVDFIPSRGAKNVKGDTWVPMDVAFKQYLYTEGMNLQNVVNYDAQLLIDQLSNTAQFNDQEGWSSGIDINLLQASIIDLQDQLSENIQNVNPNATGNDIIGAKSIIISGRKQLSSSLPFKNVLEGIQISRLPDVSRHKFRLKLYGSELNRGLGLPIIEHTVDLSVLADNKVTLSFTPLTQADEDLISSYLPLPHPDGSPILPEELPGSLPGYLIHMKAELRVDGVLVSSGGDLTLGQEIILEKSLWRPDKEWNTEVNNFLSGSYIAVKVNGAGVSTSHLVNLRSELNKTLDDITQGNPVEQDSVVGDMLYGTVSTYFGLLDAIGEMLSNSVGVVQYRLPSFGSFLSDLEVNYLFGLPSSVKGGGMLMDIDRSANLAVSKDGVKENRFAFTNAIGMLSSALENIVPEEIFSTETSPLEGVSAVKLITRANEIGQRVYHLTSSNYESVLPILDIDSEVKSEITAAIKSGKIATVHESNITISRWSGVGYIIIDPITGSGAYKLSGGANGGWVDSFVDKANDVVWTISQFTQVLIDGPIKKLLNKLTGYIGLILDLMDAIFDCPNGIAAILIISYIALFVFVLAMAAALSGIGAGPIIAYSLPTMFGLIAGGLLNTLKTAGCEQ